MKRSVGLITLTTSIAATVIKNSCPWGITIFTVNANRILQSYNDKVPECHTSTDTQHRNISSQSMQHGSLNPRAVTAFTWQRYPPPLNDNQQNAQKTRQSHSLTSNPRYPPRRAVKVLDFKNRIVTALISGINNRHFRSPPNNLMHLTPTLIDGPLTIAPPDSSDEWIFLSLRCKPYVMWSLGRW